MAIKHLKVTILVSYDDSMTVPSEDEMNTRVFEAILDHSILETGKELLDGFTVEVEDLGTVDCAFGIPT